MSKHIDTIVLGDTRFPVSLVSRKTLAGNPVHLVCAEGRGGALGFCVNRDSGRLLDADASRLAEWCGVTRSEARAEVERVALAHGA